MKKSAILITLFTILLATATNTVHARHTASATMSLKNIEVAQNVFSYTTWVDGRNCDLPYIQATNLIAFPEGSKFHTYLTNVSSDSGFVSATTAGQTATSIRTQARMGGPYANIKFNYAIQLITPATTYTWEFIGWDGTSWEGCNSHVPTQVSFSQASVN